MNGIMEFVLLFIIVFRWFTAFLGSVLILFLIRWRRQKKGKSQNWLFNTVILVTCMVVVFSTYIILVLDLRIPLPTF